MFWIIIIFGFFKNIIKNLVQENCHLDNLILTRIQVFPILELYIIFGDKYR